MRVWVTRTQPGADATAARLAAMGHEPVTAPLLTVHDLDPPLDLSDVGAIAFSSAAAVARLAARARPFGQPVFAVGDATAQAARAAGFTDVRSADGDVEALARLIVSAGVGGTVLHAGPAEPAGDLVGALASAGIAARRVALYETREAHPDPPADFDAVLVHSPKAGAALARVAEAHPRLRRSPVYALSPACAQPLTAAGFAMVHAASAPREEALLQMLR